MGHSLFVQLIINSSFGVKSILFILLLLSIYSWGVILKKIVLLKKIKKEINLFENIFWKNDLVQNYKLLNLKKMGISATLFKNNFEYYIKTLKKNPKVPKDDICEIIVGDFEINIQKFEQKIRKRLPFIGTISSSSPYIGLFGTVYGILITFWGLGSSNHENALATIAPHISEALIATGMGLFVAIPALIFFNKINSDCNEIKENLNNIEEGFINLINKHYVDKMYLTKINKK